MQGGHKRSQNQGARAKENRSKGGLKGGSGQAGVWRGEETALMAGEEGDGWTGLY